MDFAAFTATTGGTTNSTPIWARLAVQPSACRWQPRKAPSMCAMATLKEPWPQTGACAPTIPPARPPPCPRTAPIIVSGASPRESTSPTPATAPTGKFSSRKVQFRSCRERPTTWLHWDPKTVAERGPNALLRFRMDFLLLLPAGARIVVEVDGRHHYADQSGHADPARYGAMASADRDLRLAGYGGVRGLSLRG